MTVHDEGFDGLRVLVTGGTRGMGEATAKRFAAADAQVLVAARSAPPEDFPATFIPADLSTEHGIAELGRRVLGEVDGIDVLVNNAGVASELASTLQTPEEPGALPSTSTCSAPSGWTGYWFRAWWSEAAGWSSTSPPY